MDLFTVFHSNLAFSSIPSDHYDWVLDGCYWPLLDFIQTQKIKTGLEFSGHTLRILQKLDPLFIKTVKELTAQGMLEPVCGAQHQSIGPLMPAEDNLYNYMAGRKTFNDILDHDVKLFYIPEQTVSRGILGLIAESGYDAVFVEWNNAERFGQSKVDKRLLYQSPEINSQNGRSLRLLWNHSVLFQKVQRYLFGDINKKEILSYLARENEGHSGIMCLYGSDLEIFGYFPGNTLQYTPEIGQTRWRLFRELIDELMQQYRFVLPSRAVTDYQLNESIELGSAAFPILCKKQPKYNPVRWSVCGRGAYQINRKCFRLSRRIKMLADAGLITPDRKIRLRDSLSSCWASDYRTFTTEEKWQAVQAHLYRAESAIHQSLNGFETDQKIKPDEILILLQTGEKLPVILELDLRFLPNAVFPGAEAWSGHTRIPVQWEDIHVYGDGSARSARVVLFFNGVVAPLTRIRFSGRDDKNIARQQDLSGFDVDHSVSVSFNRRRGFCLDKASFLNVSDSPLVGTIPHGFFESIDWDADFYSGGAQIDTGNDFHHDLSPVQSIQCFTGPIRSFAEGIIPMGPVTQKKHYAIYKEISRIDIKQAFMINGLNSVSFRCGIITLLPEAWNRPTLYMVTQNGGTVKEAYPLSGQRVSHSEAVKSGISSRSCLGATDGWTAFTDGKKTLTISRNLMQGYSAPLLRYEEIGDQFFARIYHSLGERDDTSLFTYRGLLEESFSLTAAPGETIIPAYSDFVVFQTERKDKEYG